MVRFLNQTIVIIVHVIYWIRVDENFSNHFFVANPKTASQKLNFVSYTKPKVNGPTDMSGVMVLVDMFEPSHGNPTLLEKSGLP